MKFILDTNVLLTILRESDSMVLLQEKFQLFSAENELIVSIVSIGEIKSLAYRRKWGRRRLGILREFLKNFIIVGIEPGNLVEYYAEIDAFSQGKLNRTKLGCSSRNMGKNDLWIAATTALLDATLITMDDDFKHLSTAFISVLPLDVASFAK